MSKLAIIQQIEATTEDTILSVISSRPGREVAALYHKWYDFARADGKLLNRSIVINKITNKLNCQPIVVNAPYRIYNWISTQSQFMVLIQYSERGMSVRTPLGLTDDQKFQVLQHLSQW
jgi:hypothetical protein